MTVENTPHGTPSPTDPEFDVRDFGACGDGRAKDTAAIQAAIDRCAAGGGGRVRLPAGCWLSGTVYLGDNVELHLASGARLLASPDPADYNGDDMFPESPGSRTENSSGAHLVVAYRRRNVSITGPGTIDGNSGAFFDHGEDADLPYRYKVRRQELRSWPWRPGQMVWFCRCRRVTVRDARLVGTPYWTLLLLGCEDVQLRDLAIVNPPTTWNGDGIDIDCCRNVTVSDCLVRTGDDCLTLRANRRRLGEDAPPTENIVVTNCVLSTPTCAIRVGVGDGVIRHCRFSNIVVTDARTGICLMSRYSDSPAFRHGADISGIDFSDFTLDCIEPFHLTLGAAAPARPPAVIRDVSFTRFRITASRGAKLLGQPGMPLERLDFRQIRWRVRHDPAVAEPGGHLVGSHRPLPAAHACALFATDLADCRFEDIRLAWDEPPSAQRDGFRFHDCRALELRDLRLRQPRLGDRDGAALRLAGCADTSVSGCRAEPGTGTFLRVEKSPPGSTLECRDNDPGTATDPVVSDIPISG